MTTNPYFRSNWYSQEAQDLHESLIIESIQQYGIDLYYMPRELVNFDQLFGEDAISQFTKAFKVEFYPTSIQSYDGVHDILTKFGLEIQDEFKLVVSIKRFGSEVVEKANMATLHRPREGDLVFFAQDPAIFEVTHVADKPYFFQFGKLMTYELNCRRMVVSGEKIATGIQEIDAVNQWTATLALVLGTGTGNFTVGETVSQGTTTATVVSWDAAAKLLILNQVKGDFVAAVNVIGGTSTANWTFPTKSTTTYMPNYNKHNNGVVDNELITDESVTVVDDTEKNPLLS